MAIYHVGFKQTEWFTVAVEADNEAEAKEIVTKLDDLWDHASSTDYIEIDWEEAELMADYPGNYAGAFIEKEEYEVDGWNI